MKHLNMTSDLYDYLLDKSLREHPTLQRLREKTSTLELGMMQVSPEQGQFLQFLLRTLSAKKVLELGTFTGYSALAMALALPEDGQLITCDLSENWTSYAHPFWQEAGQTDKIQLRLGKALDSLNALIEEGQSAQFDFIFIDADKTNYLNYYELALKLIRPKGIIAIDNIFWGGQILDPNDVSAQTREIRKLNDFIKTDTRVNVSLLAIADGMFLIQLV